MLEEISAGDCCMTFVFQQWKNYAATRMKFWFPLFFPSFGSLRRGSNDVEKKKISIKSLTSQIFSNFKITFHVIIKIILKSREYMLFCFWLNWVMYIYVNTKVPETKVYILHHCLTLIWMGSRTHERYRMINIKIIGTY